MSSGLLVIDLKFTLIGLLENSDLGLAATTVFSFDCCCSFCFFSRAANLRSSSLDLLLAASNSAEDTIDLELELKALLEPLFNPQFNPRSLASIICLLDVWSQLPLSQAYCIRLLSSKLVIILLLYIF